MSGVSRTSKIIQGTVVSAVASVGYFFIYTKHCEVQEPLDPSTEPLFQSTFFRKYNPHNNYVSSDVIIRRVPLTHIRPDLIQDAQYGGSKLVEHFCGSIWSGLPFTLQRYLHSRGAPENSVPPPDPSADVTPSPILNEVAQSTKSTWSRLTSVFSSSSPSQATTEPSSPGLSTPSTTEPPQNLWSPTSLATSTYPPGTAITNHFLVLSHTPTAILVRCGSSPLDNPYSPRASDGLFEISVVPDFEKGFAEFKLKSIFYNGTDKAQGKGKEDGMGMSPRMWWLHQQYAKLWMESAVGKCRLGQWRSHEGQRQRIREEVGKEEK